MSDARSTTSRSPLSVARTLRPGHVARTPRSCSSRGLGRSPRHPFFIWLFAAILAGCASSRSEPEKLPPGAELIAAQKGGMVLAPRAAGTAYVFDTKTGKIVYTTVMKPGDKLVLFPEKDQILLNGIVAQETDLDPTRVYRFYYLKG